MTYEETLKEIGLEPSETEFLKDMNMIRNMFYVGFMPVDFLIEHVKKMVKAKKSMLEKAIKENDLAAYVFIHERPYRLEALLKGLWKIKTSKIKKAIVIGDVWIDGEGLGVNIDVWKNLFRTYGKLMMDKEDKAVWDALPDEFEVWHGDEGENDGRISWTLSKKVAEFFAKRFTDNPRAIESRIVKKEDCVCYFGGRGEEEIIILD